MANFVVTCIDRPGALEGRAAHRPAHLAFLNARPELVKLAGPLLDDSGGVIGSLLVVEAEDSAAAETFLAGDPYAQAGLFARTEIRPWRITVGALA